MQALALSEDDLGKRNMPLVFGVALLLSLVAAINLAAFIGPDAGIGFGCRGRLRPPALAGWACSSAFSPLSVRAPPVESLGYSRWILHDRAHTYGAIPTRRLGKFRAVAVPCQSQADPAIIASLFIHGVRYGLYYRVLTILPIHQPTGWSARVGFLFPWAVLQAHWGDPERILTQLPGLEGYDAWWLSYADADIGGGQYLWVYRQRQTGVTGCNRRGPGRKRQGLGYRLHGCREPRYLPTLHPRSAGRNWSPRLPKRWSGAQRYLPPPVLEETHDPFVDLVPPQGIKLTPRHYAYLKISEGCNHRCSFCIIPSMRGDLVSRPIGEVLDEAERLAAAGVRRTTGYFTGHQCLRC